jgi:pyruvate/2-oxoacid:ferredoxin oxidoreductase alpha subunit
MVGFFPIGPSDEVAEEIARLIERGQMSATIMDLQNERSVMNAMVMGSEAGVRTIFATNSEGLYFAAEPIKAAAPHRVPVVVAVANRALEPPLIVTPDYQDTVSLRDTFWLQLYCENPQDVLDTTIQAYRIAEDRSIRLPAFVCFDGWEVSHSSFTVSMPDQVEVDAFVPPYVRDPEDDIATFDYRQMYHGQRTLAELGADDYMEQRYQLVTAHQRALGVIEEVNGAYARLTGRDWGGVIDAVETADAEVVVVTMGAITSTARLATAALRKAGRRVGLVKLRAFRPFPAARLRATLARARAVVVIERDISGAIYQELRHALFGSRPCPAVLGRVAGIGGRDVTPDDIVHLTEEGFAAAAGDSSVEEFRWHFGLRGARVVRGA